MIQSVKTINSRQAIELAYPEIHAALQKVAESIYAKKEDAVSISQEIKLEQAIALGFLKQQEEKVVFAESALQANYLVQYAVNQLVLAWNDIGAFLDNVTHLYRCSILLKYDLALGTQAIFTLVHEHNKDLLNRIVEVATLRSTEDVSHEHFWPLYELFCGALADLRPEPKPLADVLEVVASINSGAEKIQYKMQDLLKQSQETVEAFYQEFANRSNPLFIELIFTTLLILSEFDFYAAHQRALSFANSDDAIKINLGITVLGRLNYSHVQQSELLALTLTHFNEFLTRQDTNTDARLTRAYGDLLDQASEAVAKFLELASKPNLAIRQEVAQVLCRRAEKSFQQDWFKTALFSLLQEPLLHPGILEKLDFGVRHCISTEPSIAIQTIETLALNWDYTKNTEDTLPNVLQHTLIELFNHSRDELNTALTQWFASRIPRLHRAASEIELFFASKPSNNLNENASNNLKPPVLLSKPVLDSLDELTVQQVLYRVAGYVTGGVSLAALILSAAQREPISRSLAEQIIILLSDYVVYNYPNRAREYLSNRLREETLAEVERQIVQAALERFDHYLQSRQSLPPLKELQAPPSRIYAYYQAQWKQNADIVERAKERSVLWTIFSGREIPIKYGKASARFDSAAQKVSEPMRFAPLSYEYDVPQSDVIDPVGHTYQRWQWRTVGFEQATNILEIESAEPEDETSHS